MNAEFFDAVADIEKEKGIPREYMYEKIRQAMLTAFRKDTPDCEDNVEVILDEDKKKIEMVVKKTVVARVIDPYVEISEEAAHRVSKILFQIQDRLPVALKAEAHVRFHARHAGIGDLAKRLPGADVRQVHLHRLRVFEDQLQLGLYRGHARPGGVHPRRGAA